MAAPRGFYRSSKGDLKDIETMDFMNIKNAVLKIRRDGFADDRATEIEDLVARARVLHQAWCDAHPDEPAGDMEWAS